MREIRLTEKEQVSHFSCLFHPPQTIFYLLHKFSWKVHVILGETLGEDVCRRRLFGSKVFVRRQCKMPPMKRGKWFPRHLTPHSSAFIRSPPLLSSLAFSIKEGPFIRSSCTSLFGDAVPSRPRCFLLLKSVSSQRERASHVASHCGT